MQLQATDGVEITISGAFTTHHRLQKATSVLGELVLLALRSGGTFHGTTGCKWTLCRTSWWWGRYELRKGESVLGVARPHGFFRRGFVVQFGDREYALRPASFWTWTWRLTDGTGRMLLEIRRRGVFRRGAYLTAMATVDVGLLVFAYYLVYVRWQETTTAAAAAAS